MKTLQMLILSLQTTDSPGHIRELQEQKIIEIFQGASGGKAYKPVADQLDTMSRSITKAGLQD
jgi:hypothetical protein